MRQEPDMDMDSKKLTYKNTLTVFCGLVIVVLLIIVSLINVLWNKYYSLNIDKAKAQIEILNNYIIAKVPGEEIDLYSVHHIVFNDNDSPIENIFFSIYDDNNKLLFTTITTKSVFQFPKYEEVFDKLDYETQKINLHHNYYDSFLEMDCINSVTYSRTLKKYIITECTVINEVSVSEFISKTYIKLSLIIVMAIIALVCIYLLFRYINNVERLKRFILKLGEANNYEISDDQGITDDLYTLYKRQLEIIKKHDKEREIAIAEEKERLLSKRALANNLNHEIKTPIGIIMGYLDTLVNHPDIDKNTRLVFLNKCIQNTQRLQNMVINLAIINRLDDGSNNIALEKTSLRNVAMLVKEDLKFTISENHMNFKIDIGPEILVKSNEMLLYNILSNLVKNSCFYSDGTSMVLRIISKDQQFYTISFYDNGSGVPEESISKLFNRFYRIDKYKVKKNGTGLGLAIVKESVNLCNGTITASNRIEGGLEFHFTLPIA